LSKTDTTVVDEGIKELWNPDQDALKRCRTYGRNFVRKL
jgi:hypothetical protein